MSDQPNLFGESPDKRHRLDAREARGARDDALQRVAEHSNPDWVRSAKAVVRDLAYSLAEFATDEAWRQGLPKPREARAMGPVMMWAVRQGLVANSGRVKKTAQVSRHAAPVTIWESLVYRPESSES